MPARAHRDFDADGFTVDAKELDMESGPTFTLGGETFRAMPELPAGAYALLPTMMNAEEAALFLRRALVPKDEPRFVQTLLSKNRVVKLFISADTHRTRLHEIADWLLDAHGGGLTPFSAIKPELSQNGASATAATSAGSSDERESTPAS